MNIFNRGRQNQNDGGAGGNQNQNNNQNSNQNQNANGNNGGGDGNNQNAGGGNNNGSNLPNPFATGNNNNNGNDGNNGNGGGNNQNQSPNAADQARQRREYYAQTGLYQNLDFGQFQKDVAEGNAEGMTQFMQQLSENAVNVAILSSQKLIKGAVDKAVSDASDNATARVRNDMAVEMMHQQMEFTRNPAIKPMAEQVLNGFIAQGNDATKAVELTKQYFDATAKAMGFQNSNNGQRPGNRGFNGAPPMNGNNNPAGGAGADDDWLDILTGQTSA